MACGAAEARREPFRVEAASQQRAATHAVGNLRRPTSRLPNRTVRL